MTPSPPFRPLSNPPRSLFELAERFGLTEVDDGEPRTDVSLYGVTLSTDDVKECDLFVGLAGQKHHGARFAEAARASGAVAVLTDEAGVDAARSSGLPIVVADDPRSVLGAVSAWVYGTDVHRPTMYGVTGTTGKTSTVYLIEAILRQMGVLVGLSSTAERHIGSEAQVSALTTPEATELHGLLGRAVEE
ncbi:MAG: Mur ligase family protein, partial [Rhodoglobus sp.]|nr:Mur ligase family protein [Rhodoglobus sp.]